MLRLASGLARNTNANLLHNSKCHQQYNGHIICTAQTKGESLSKLIRLDAKGFPTSQHHSICGAIFMTTTQLTEHIHSHVRNRHCCVCRHITGVISEAQNPRRLFFCEFCGKPFSRAYCCELHQQSCAKRLGRLRDVTSSLVLLR
nr:zinc finger protein 90 homolog isoform X2 [Plodia interpunctella]XP_053614533.1 zinc finger protein 90 homolog isoform X2 [Plodia interpunctella]XP_053614534.1 zinc finger protein 90 homolog isoform X2 [Plodia interpunctella]